MHGHHSTGRSSIAVTFAMLCICVSAFAGCAVAPRSDTLPKMKTEEVAQPVPAPSAPPSDLAVLENNVTEDASNYVVTDIGNPLEGFTVPAAAEPDSRIYSFRIPEHTRVKVLDRSVQAQRVAVHLEEEYGHVVYFKIEFNGKVGWISEHFLKNRGLPATEDTPPEG